MPGQRPILAMSFIASLGITFVVLACKVPKNDGNFWPLLVILFYILLPIPFIVSRRIRKDTMIGMSSSGSKCTRDLALFFTSGVMVSSIALPLVLARSPESKPLVSFHKFLTQQVTVIHSNRNDVHQQVAPTSCLLVEFGNLLCLVTLALFYIYFTPKDGF